MAYSGSIAITEINGDSVTSSSVYFVGRTRSLGAGVAIISGTYSGDVPVSVSYQCGSATAQKLALFTASGGVWTGKANSITTGVSLTLIATNSGGSQSSAVVMASFGCGDFGLIAGQSNAGGQIVDDYNSSGDMLPTAYIEDSVMFYFDVFTLTFKAGVPHRDYHLASAFALLSRKTLVPICTVNVGIGGTQVESWLYPSGDSWIEANAQIVAAHVPEAENDSFLIWFQGENDVGTDPDEYKVLLQQFVWNARAYWGASEILAVPVPLPSAAHIANATIEAATGGSTYLYPACCASDIRIDSPDYGDDLHIKRPSEGAIMGNRIGQTLIWRAGYLSPAIGQNESPAANVRYLNNP